MARRIFNVNPLIEVELMEHSLLSDYIARIDILDDGSVEGFVGF